MLSRTIILVASLLIPYSVASADRYKVKKIMRQSDKAVIITGEDGDFIERGDKLYLENDFGTCQVRVLKTTSRKALISLDRCGFKVKIGDVVTVEGVHGVDYSMNYQDIYYDDEASDDDRKDTRQTEYEYMDARQIEYEYENRGLDQEQDKVKKKEIEQGQYVGGGIVALLIGLGIGHAVQGRYGEGGWVHTVFQLSGSIMLATGGITSSGIGGFLLVGSRIAEIVGIWIIDKERYEIVSNNKQLYQKGSISLLPAFNAKGNAGLQLVASLPIR